MIFAAHAWRNNADLIADVAELGYLRKEWRTLDPTYGRGKWWTNFRPDDLVTHDIRQDGMDFTKADLRLRYEQDPFDAIAFDPPYMAPGGRKTSTVADMNDAYGMHEAAKTPSDNQRNISVGIYNLGTILKPGGIMLVKVMDYISGGKFFNATYATLRSTIGLKDPDLELIDRFIHLTNGGPQPKHPRQVHARNNFSTLFVFRKVKK